MRDVGRFHHEVSLALSRIAADAAITDEPEEALWLTTRMLPSLLGDRDAATDPTNLPQGARPQSACTAFMRTPDGRYHLITAPVNFAPEQYHEKVAINLGHPGHVAATQRPLLLRDTSHHTSFVKILQTFRAGSAVQTPMLWRGRSIGVLICANAARNTFAEIDLLAMQAFTGLAAAVWIASGGPAWLETLDYAKLPERLTGS